MAFLQSYVVPICLTTSDASSAKLRKLCGTAFFIGKQGYFLTAGHVLKHAIAEAAEKDLCVSLIVKPDDKSPDKSAAINISAHEFAPTPYDVAVGRVNFKPVSPLKLQAYKASMWKEVAALGYPESASIWEDDALWMNLNVVVQM